MTIAKSGTNQNIPIGNATSAQLLSPSETFESGTQQQIRVIRCVTSGTVTLTGQNDADTVNISLTAGEEILWGSWRKVVADSTFEGIIAG